MIHENQANGKNSKPIEPIPSFRGGTFCSHNPQEPPSCMNEFRWLVGLKFNHACMYVTSIMKISTIPNRVATLVVLAPKMLPSTIKKTAIAHTKLPTLSTHIANYAS